MRALGWVQWVLEALLLIGRGLSSSWSLCWQMVGNGREPSPGGHCDPESRLTLTSHPAGL